MGPSVNWSVPPIRVMDRCEAEKNTLGAILRRYQTEVTPPKKSAGIESVMIDVIMKTSP